MCFAPWGSSRLVKKHKKVFWVRGEKGCNAHPDFGRLDMREIRKDVKISGQQEVKQRRLTMHEAGFMRSDPRLT
jgi:hypothetical protein